jgi:hypothetical protein
MSFSRPAPEERNFGFRENQSQKLERSRSPGGSEFACGSRQSPEEPGLKKRQFLQERISLPQFSQRRDRPIGSEALTGLPQYQHMESILTRNPRYG